MAKTPSTPGSTPPTTDPAAPQHYHPLFHISGDHPEEERIAHALEAIAGALCRLDARIAAALAAGALKSR